MTEVVWHAGAVSAERRIATTGGRGVTVWLTGLSGSGKATIAYGFENRLVTNGRAAYVLDGDNLRHHSTPISASRPRIEPRTCVASANSPDSWPMPGLRWPFR